MNDAVFAAEVNEAIIYDVVKMQLASRRSALPQRKREAMSAAAEKNPGVKKEPAGPDLERRDHLSGEVVELFLVSIPWDYSQHTQEGT